MVRKTVAKKIAKTIKPKPKPKAPKVRRAQGKPATRKSWHYTEPC